MSTSIALDRPEMTFPVFTLNSNSPKVLGNEYWDALQALRDFEHKFYAVEFHSRDYYTQEPANWNKAVDERNEIKKNISAIRNYLDALTAHCFEAAK